MSVTLLSTLALLIAPATGRGERPPSKLDAFRAQAAAMGLALRVPARYREVEVRKNPDMEYDYALRDPSRKLEIRYSLRPLDPRELAAYAAFKKNPPKGPEGKPPPVMLDPNDIYSGLFEATALNVAGGGDVVEPRHFPSQAVKEEFGADDGLVTSVSKMHSSFGQGFKRCMLFVLHRKDVGEAYVFVLFDRDEDFSSLPDAAFHSLGFTTDRSAPAAKPAAAPQPPPSGK
jgi:hypothetical protein